jgi:hypothetical protein
MSGPMTWAVGDAALWLVVAGIVISETRQWLKGRRLDREARERRDAQDQRIAEALKASPEPLLDGQEAARLFASLHEATTSANERKP